MVRYLEILGDMPPRIAYTGARVKPKKERDKQLETRKPSEVPQKAKSPVVVRREPADGRRVLIYFEERFRAQRFRVWIGYEYPSGDEEWSVRCDGTSIQIATWIERILPASPDPELIRSGLDELEKQIPVGNFMSKKPNTFPRFLPPAAAK